jgi:hypothetical protein
MNRYDYSLSDFSLDRAEIRFTADTAMKNCAIITDGKRPRISSIWGHEEIARLPMEGLRAAFTDSKGTTFFVCGDTVYSTADFRHFERRGQIGSQQGYVSFAESQSQNTAEVFLYFTDGVSLWRANTLSASPVENLNSHLPRVNGTYEIAVPSFLSFYQHRLLMTCKNSNQWFFSLLDPDSKERIFGDSNLNFYSTETRADRLLRVMATDMIYLFGERTVEVWKPTGSDTDPYISNTATNFGVGTAYPLSITDYHNDIYFVATDNHLYQLSGGQMRKISSGDMSSYFNAQIAGAFPIHTNRSRHIAFKRINADAVLYNPKNETFTLAPALNDIRAAFWLGGEFNGVADSGVISRQAETALAYNGDALIREIKTPIVFPDSKIRVRLFEFAFTASFISKDAAGGTDNQVFVSMSPNGGLTWSEPRTVELDSNEGERKLYAFGMAHNVQFKITCSNKQMLDIHRITILYDVSER